MGADDKKVQEIYVRFRDLKGNSGVHETPCADVCEAAGVFQGDHDCVSAFRIELNPAGRVVDVSDVTESVLASLLDLYREGSYEGDPHPMIEDEFFAKKSAWERECLESDEHIRIESSTPQP